jgi:hypothetical protein
MRIPQQYCKFAPAPADTHTPRPLWRAEPWHRSVGWDEVIYVSNPAYEVALRLGSQRRSATPLPWLFETTTADITHGPPKMAHPVYWSRPGTTIGAPSTAIDQAAFAQLLAGAGATVETPPHSKRISIVRLAISEAGCPRYSV